jgi:hypothetical protein
VCYARVMTSFAHLCRLAGIVALAALCTCGTLDRIDVDTSASVQIPRETLTGQLIGALTFKEFEELDFSEQIANQGVREDQIDSATVKSFVVHTDEGSGATLDFLQSVKFYAEAEGQPRLLVASSDSFEGETSVELTLEPDAELKPYLTAPSMTLAAEVVGKYPKEDTRLTADVTVSVDVTVPGCE